jgi:hypothetical protein
MPVQHHMDIPISDQMLIHIFPSSCFTDTFSMSVLGDMCGGWVECIAVDYLVSVLLLCPRE